MTYHPDHSAISHPTIPAFNTAREGAGNLNCLEKGTFGPGPVRAGLAGCGRVTLGEFVDVGLGSFS